MSAINLLLLIQALCVSQNMMKMDFAVYKSTDLLYIFMYL